MSSLRSLLPSSLRARLSRDPLRRRLAWRGVYDRKVFVVGRNKTGTTTMEAVLKHYRFRVGLQSEGEPLLDKHLGESSPELWSWIDRREAFQDIPFSNTWFLPELFRRYPTARYILTVRDPEEWFASLVNHHFSLFGLPQDAPRAEVAAALRRQPNWAPGHHDRNHRRQYDIISDDQLYDRDLYIANYHAHAATVRAVVPAAQLLEINLSEHPTTATICRFLGIPGDLAMPMPRENRRR